MHVPNTANLTIASFPMYNRAELDDAHRRYWAAIRARFTEAGIESPISLSQDQAEASAWTDPGLVLSQTCGMPYRMRLHGHVTLIGTPDYRIQGCAPGYGRSGFVVRSDDSREFVTDFADGVFAYNQDHSESGYNSPYHYVAARGFWFKHQLHAGQHVESARSVAEGRADIASVDAVTLRLIQRYETFADDLRVIAWTDPVPWLPYVSRVGVDIDIMFDAVRAAIGDLHDEDRDALGIYDLVKLPADLYLSVPNPPAEVTATLQK